jgi:hypothetical protein
MYYNLNVSKTGISATAGLKGLSVNVGKNGAYINTGIPGTGIYDRVKIGGNNMTDAENRNLETLWDMAANDEVRASLFKDSFNSPCKTFNGILSAFLFLIGLPALFIGLIGLILFISESSSFRGGGNDVFITFIVLTIVGLAFYGLHLQNHIKAKKNKRALLEHSKKEYAEYQENLQKLEEANQKILEAKLNTINGHELFDGAKIFSINRNNIIAFSQKRCVALWTEKNTDSMHILGIDKITKINQEIKGGDCYALIYTDDFENNVYQFFIGNAHGKDETENVRKLYNEIKGLYTTLKNNK